LPFRVIHIVASRTDDQMRRDSARRRRVLRAAGRVAAIGGAGIVAGCSDGEDDDVPGAAATIEVDPDGSLRFVPSEVSILSGETVVWTFENAGHNVSANPDHAGKASIPEGAEPFATYEGDKKFQTVPPGERFSRTFETTGDYQYVCVPHASQGMVGTIHVE
jgi:plastocyanin